MTRLLGCPNHFNNLLALDVQEEAAQEAIHDAHAGEWRKVERGHRNRWVDPYPQQYRREALAQQMPPVCIFTLSYFGTF